MVFVLVVIILVVVTVVQRRNKDYSKWSENYNSELGSYSNYWDTLEISKISSLFYIPVSPSATAELTSLELE